MSNSGCNLLWWIQTYLSALFLHISTEYSSKGNFDPKGAQKNKASQHVSTGPGKPQQTAFFTATWVVSGPRHIGTARDSGTGEARELLFWRCGGIYRGFIQNCKWRYAIFAIFRKGIIWELEHAIPVQNPKRNNQNNHIWLTNNSQQHWAQTINNDWREHSFMWDMMSSKAIINHRYWVAHSRCSKIGKASSHPRERSGVGLWL
jgi:hypothetical protein